MQLENILLHPRPYAHSSGKLLLLPLLPHRKPTKPLPAEVWTYIFSYAVDRHECSDTRWPWSLVTTCRAFKDIVLPLLYARVDISRISGLEKLYNCLYTADRKWDSIRRIPYSSPGRWIQVLNLSELAFTGRSQALLLDSILTNLFPLVPLLSHLSVNPSFILSRRALLALAGRHGASNIRILEGLSYTPSHSSRPDDDPFVSLLRQCPNLQYLDAVGQGPDPAELEFKFANSETSFSEDFTPLNLPDLKTLTLLSMHSSSLMLALLYSPLPSLKKLTITPYDDIPFPSSMVSQFIAVHGYSLKSLLLFTPKSWPTRLHPSPDSLLKSSPILRHLSLEVPVPSLSIPDLSHPLEIISIPRPTEEIWRILERLFPKLPQLSLIRARDVRWLRKGMTLMAQGAGVQGEMKEWQRRLRRRGIRLVDTDWNENI